MTPEPAAGSDAHAGTEHHREPTPDQLAPDGGGAGSVFQYWWLAYLRTWRGSLFASFLAPVMYLAAMGYGLGALVDGGERGGIGGVAYVAFIAPGVLAATAMQTAAGECTFPIMAGMKWNMYFHAILATPLRVRHLVLGHLYYLVVRLTIVCGVFMVVALALGTARSWWAPLALPAAVLTGLAFAAPITAYAATQDDAGDGFNVIFRFVIMPMFLFSGTFFPIDQLHPVLQPVAWVTPLWHGVELARGFTLGTATVPGALGHTLYLALWVGAGLWLSDRLLSRRLVS